VTQLADLVFVLVGQLDNFFVSIPLKVVRLNDGLKYWEPMLYISRVVVFVCVNTCDFDFIARACGIDQIVKHHDFFLPRDSARWYTAWSLLNCHLLVIAIDRLLLTDCVRAKFGTAHTLANFHLCFKLVIAVKRTFDVAAYARKIHGRVLREHAGTLGNDASEFNECIEVHLAQLSKLVFNGEIVDSHKDVLVCVLVVRIHFSDQVHRNNVKHRDNQRRFLS
jgi:hypothetical protein